MRVAINLLTENPEPPSGAHWFWTRVIPDIGFKRAAEFTWGATAASTLDVYRDVAENRGKRQK